MQLFERVTRSARVTVVATLVGAILQAFIMVVLIRLLTPSDYGIYAAALAITAVSVSFIVGTCERALMVSDYSISIEGRSIPIFAVITAVAVFILSVIALIHATSLAAIPMEAVAALFVGQIAQSFSIVAKVHLRRKLEFGWITAGELLGQFFGNGVVAILLARSGYGYQSLLAGAVVQGAIVMAVIQSATPMSLIWPIRWRGITAVVKVALGLGQSSVIEVARVYLPIFILSRLGEVALGVFNRAYSLVHLPLEVVSGAINRVAISALIEVADDRERLRKVAEIYVLVVTALVLPVAGGVAGSSVEFTLIMMGKNWQDAISLVPWVALAAACLVASRCMGIIGEALCAFRVKAVIEFASMLILLGAMSIGTLHGLVASVVGMGLAGLFYWGSHVLMVANLLEVSPLTVLMWHVPALVSGSMCFALSLTVNLSELPIPLVGTFAIQIFGCAFATVVYYILTQRAVLVSFWREYRKLSHIDS